MARHQGNHHGYTDAIRNALDKINLNQSINTISKQVTHIQNIAKKIRRMVILLNQKIGITLIFRGKT
ncbi:AHH domain-containing protein [Photorhabdus sp. APURE]|uniref:AHH domain-containing protein n=1 Tax=Photorhabdus aballayi TaxID=2991723 RepID=UPI00223E0D0D|nr:AHH domain-containing protein [Photorhabdus aballayi]MCW7550979.1 AHH domain-containing protein [Photorhabdus aballayi]